MSSPATVMVGLVLRHRLLVTFADTGDRSKLEASGTEDGEARTVRVIFDRFADVQLVNSGARRDGNTLHHDGMRVVALRIAASLRNQNQGRPRDFG